MENVTDIKYSRIAIPLSTGGQRGFHSNAINLRLRKTEVSISVSSFLLMNQKFM
jgi:hypothetical protein